MQLVGCQIFRKKTCLVCVAVCFVMNHGLSKWPDTVLGTSKAFAALQTKTNTNNGTVNTAENKNDSTYKWIQVVKDSIASYPTFYLWSDIKQEGIWIFLSFKTGYVMVNKIRKHKH